MIVEFVSPSSQSVHLTCQSWMHTIVIRLGCRTLHLVFRIKRRGRRGRNKWEGSKGTHRGTFSRPSVRLTRWLFSIRRRSLKKFDLNFTNSSARIKVTRQHRLATLGADWGNIYFWTPANQTFMIPRRGAMIKIYIHFLSLCFIKGHKLSSH